MEADADARGNRIGFAAWLDVLAPVYARLYLRHGSPLWNAIFDLRAAMIIDRWGDSSSDDWAHDDGIWWRAPRTLEACGILIPRAIFDRVWRIYRESGGTLWRETYDLFEQDAERDGDCWARSRLLDAARDALRYGPEEVTRRRYGCGPDRELMR